MANATTRTRVRSRAGVAEATTTNHVPAPSEPGVNGEPTSHQIGDNPYSLKRLRNIRAGTAAAGAVVAVPVVLFLFYLVGLVELAAVAAGWLMLMFAGVPLYYAAKRLFLASSERGRLALRLGITMAIVGLLVAATGAAQQWLLTACVAAMIVYLFLGIAPRAEAWEEPSEFDV